MAQVDQGHTVTRACRPGRTGLGNYVATHPAQTPKNHCHQTKSNPSHRINPLSCSLKPASRQVKALKRIEKLKTPLKNRVTDFRVRQACPLPKGDSARPDLPAIGWADTPACSPGQAQEVCVFAGFSRLFAHIFKKFQFFPTNL
jgi:hypothetical protein